VNNPVELFIEQDKVLEPLNTLGFSQSAEHFVETHSDAQLICAIEYAQTNAWPIFILGGGSNIVLTQNIPGLTIRPINTTVRYDSAGTRYKTRVTAGAGMPWHQLVTDTLDYGLRGLENLSLIPGTVGAAPVQNIGAYGVELDSLVTRVRALHIDSLQWQDFTRAQCDFSYRQSFFKANTHQYVITEVELELGESNELKYDYASLRAHLDARGISRPDALQISESVIATRRARLPDPAVLANAGSFFHNPVISKEQAVQLQRLHPGMPAYDAGEAGIKVSAAWMIEQLGFKGMKTGHVGVHDKQSLVLVHLGNGSGKELLALATQIQQAVQQRYSITLHIEPTVL